jgi:hypothetical protein
VTEVAAEAAGPGSGPPDRTAVCTLLGEPGGTVLERLPRDLNLLVEFARTT